ncbi:MAG: HAD family phosphatase [Lachnospiraceae bacterium]|nr:HAD family phosphatase [Lachnospiraceae bacterium]
MPSNYKLLFTDVDETILPAGGQISDADRSFIEALTRRGIHVTVSSGRCRDMVYPIVKELGLDKDPEGLTLSQNGGHIFKNATGETISTAPIETALVADLFLYAKEFGIRCRSYSENLVYFNHTDPAIEDFRKKYRCDCRLLSDPASQMTEPPIKFMVIDPDPARIHQYYQNTLPLTGDILRADFSSATAMEFTAKEVTKGSGLRKICEYYKIPVSEAVAIGDSGNDLTMIQTAGLGIAMYNALPVLKEHADRITRLPCAQSGFSDALSEIF